MGEIDFDKLKSRDQIMTDAAGYHLVQHANGVMHCSCGRLLIKVDEDTYRCEGGYPEWRLDKNEVFKDKYGNLYLRHKVHNTKRLKKRWD